jgi:hypothetical protein
VYVDTLVVIWYCRVGILRTLGYLSFDDFRTSFRIIESWHCGATEPMPPYIVLTKQLDQLSKSSRKILYMYKCHVVAAIKKIRYHFLLSP